MQRRLTITVGIGSAVIAAIGFIGSYAAVAELARRKNFGTFATIFPIGIDAGILCLLALDLLLTWLRIPFPLLRQTAWLLTTATIAFNAATAMPDPVGTGMHAVIPVLFVVVVEAARHAIGRTADISAGRHMESVRLIRWLLDPISTFRLWRRMKLWELRSYDQVIELEQSRLIEQARLRARYGRRWRSRAPVSAVMALRLTRYGRALAPVSGVLDIEHAPAAGPDTVALPTAQPDAVVAPVVIAQPESAAAADSWWDALYDEPTAQPQPEVQPQPQAQADAQPELEVQPQPGVRPEPTVQPDAQPEVQPQPGADEDPDAQPHDEESAPDPDADATGQPSDKGGPKVKQMRTPEEAAQLLDDARALNVNSLDRTGKKASLRLLQAELGIGQRTAQRLQKQLPNDLASAVAEQQQTKEA
ncbi:DUF2637 domain-containing protein [Streptomyces sp. SP17KL33]|nr:DUF2637 domain-containing protein [Streptomyces sp. SP17KL33]MEE1838188.1 DUF2637 domain-containing protein [Streptomyces sp. SP17KL33]